MRFLREGLTEVVALATPRELAGLPSLIDAHLAVNDDVEVRALLALDDDRLLWQVAHLVVGVGVGLGLGLGLG